MESIEEIITNQPFFSGLSPNNIELLANCASLEAATAGQYIFRTGENAEKFYLLYDGTVSLEILTPKDQIIEIQTLGTGEILGWSWQFPPFKWNFDAKAVKDTKLICFDTRRFFDTCSVNLLLAYELQRRFSKVMMDRLQATRRQLIELKSSITVN